MDDNQKGVIHSATEGGVIGKHGDIDPFQFFVGPATSNEFNTARLRLLPVACFRIDDVRFKFDSSFVLPEIQAEMNAFVDLRKNDLRVQGAPISIFGHADPTFQGDFELDAPTHQPGDSYNKVLSGRRAIAIYALLIRDAAIWNSLFTNHFGGDVWGEASIRIALDQTDPANSSSNPDPGASDSARNAKIRDIANDTSQRQQLFLKYMNALCGDLKLDKARDFLARGAGPDHKGDVQGCSRFNPLLIFAQEKESQFKEAAQDKNEGVLVTRNADNSLNRRVMILIFRKGSQVLPAKWPCPAVNEPVAGCIKRFFSDGDRRRSTHLPGTDKKFDDTHDTFACRFYQRISDNSPCDLSQRFVEVTLDDSFFGVCKSIVVDVVLADGSTDTFTTNKGGSFFVDAARGHFVDVTFRTPREFRQRRIFLVPPDPSTDQGAWQRLANMGYVREDEQGEDSPPSPASLVRAVAEFQLRHGLALSAKLDTLTAGEIEKVHSDRTPWRDRKWFDDPVVGPNDPTPKDQT
jgi:hypothetical protein